jgi:hypothetical protein
VKLLLETEPLLANYTSFDADEILAMQAIHSLKTLHDILPATHFQQREMEARRAFLTTYIEHLIDPSYSMSIHEDRELSAHARAIDPESARVIALVGLRDIAEASI